MSTIISKIDEYDEKLAKDIYLAGLTLPFTLSTPQSGSIFHEFFYQACLIMSMFSRYCR